MIRTKKEQAEYEAVSGVKYDTAYMREYRQGNRRGNKLGYNAMSADEKKAYHKAKRREYAARNREIERKRTKAYRQSPEGRIARKHTKTTPPCYYRECW